MSFPFVVYDSQNQRHMVPVCDLETFVTFYQNGVSFDCEEQAFLSSYGDSLKREKRACTKVGRVAREGLSWGALGAGAALCGSLLLGLPVGLLAKASGIGGVVGAVRGLKGGYGKAPLEKRVAKSMERVIQTGGWIRFRELASGEKWQIARLPCISVNVKCDPAEMV